MKIRKNGKIPTDRQTQWENNFSQRNETEKISLYFLAKKSKNYIYLYLNKKRSEEMKRRKKKKETNQDQRVKEQKKVRFFSQYFTFFYWANILFACKQLRYLPKVPINWLMLMYEIIRVQKFKYRVKWKAWFNINLIVWTFFLYHFFLFVQTMKVYRYNLYAWNLGKWDQFFFWKVLLHFQHVLWQV